MNAGDLIDESSVGGATHTEENLTENGSKDNKKKKRRPRRSKQKNALSASNSVHETCIDELSLHGKQCSTDMGLHKNDEESVEAQESLSIAESEDKVYMWNLLKKKKIMYSEAKVLVLGPMSMSIYIPKLDIERCVCYDEVEGLTVEWLEATSTLLLSLSLQKRSNRKNTPTRCRPLDEIALIVNPTDSKLETNNLSGCCGGPSGMITYEPSFFPLTLHLHSVIPVALHDGGGEDGPLDIVARLYVSSYYH